MIQVIRKKLATHFKLDIDPTSPATSSLVAASATSDDIDTKIECVDSLVSLLGCTDVDKMSRTFLAMSSSPANCDLMRSHRVIPLLVQLLHGPPQLETAADSPEAAKQPREVRLRVARALHNMVYAHPTDKQVWSLSSFDASRQLLTNDLDQVSSVSLHMTSSTAIPNKGLFMLTRRGALR